MKAVLQRVESAVLYVESREISAINQGLVCYLGIGRGDSLEELEWLARKVAGLRAFPDNEGKMNRSLLDCNYDIMIVSQFTLYGSLKKGYRPSFTQAESPEVALCMYEEFCHAVKKLGVKTVARGVFAADMRIEQVNCGPVTIILDTDSNA